MDGYKKAEGVISGSLRSPFYLRPSKILNTATNATQLETLRSQWEDFNHGGWRRTTLYLREMMRLNGPVCIEYEK